MKSRYFYLLTSLVLVLFFAACSDKKPQATSGEANQFVFEFTNEDSISINSLVDEYVAAYNSGDLEACADFLFTVRNDSVFPLSATDRHGFISSMQPLVSFGCERKDLTLKTDRDNKIAIALFLTEADSESSQTERPFAKFILNPVKVDDKWYLTVYDPRAEGVGIYQ